MENTPFSTSQSSSPPPAQQSSPQPPVTPNPPSQTPPSPPPQTPGSFSTRALLGVLFIAVALIVTPIAISQLQKQQDIRQRADEVQWITDQSAATSCPANGSGAIITVSFTNAEPNRASMQMDVRATDRQTGKAVQMVAISGGETKTAQIQTGRPTLSAGTVDFKLLWTDGHSGTDTRTATYRAVGNCAPPTSTPVPYYTPIPSKSPTPPYSTPKYPTPTTPKYSTPTPTYRPTPTPTKKPTPTPTYLPGTPTPTICPTLGPVKNVHIDCPNCPS